MTEDKIYVCLSCGELNGYWTTCQACEDETGGDGNEAPPTTFINRPTF